MKARRPNLKESYFLPYQWAVINDRAKHVLAEKGRRTGFTYALSYKAVEDCVGQCERGLPPTPWWFSSADETAAKEFIEYCGFWVREIFNLAAVEIGLERLLVEDREIQVQTVRFPNGARIIALTSNPKALRSKGGNVVLDEFAFHDDPRAMWAAATPVPRWGGQFIVVSTHNGDGTIFHGQCERARKEAAGPRDRFQGRADTATAGVDAPIPPENPSGGRGGAAPFWSYHFCSLDTAIGQGLVEKILRLKRRATEAEKAAFREECRRECLTQEDFDQEYLCIASSASSALLSYELIDACADAGADADWNGDRPRSGPVFAGTDVGRTHDLTYTPLLEKVGDVLWTRAALTYRDVRFRIQKEGIADLIRRAAVARLFIDGFGIGMNLAEDLAEMFGDLRVQSVQVNTTNLVLMSTRLVELFEDRRIRLPRDAALREALHKPRKITGLGGTMTVKLARDAAGHCDEFIGYGLAALAAHEGGECGPVREESFAGTRAQGALVGAGGREGVRW